MPMHLDSTAKSSASILLVLVSLAAFSSGAFAAKGNKKKGPKNQMDSSEDLDVQLENPIRPPGA